MLTADYYTVVAAKAGFVGEARFLLPLWPRMNTNLVLVLTNAQQAVSGRLRDATDPTGGLTGVTLVGTGNGFVALSFTGADGEFNMPVVPGRWLIEPQSVSLAVLGYLETLDSSPSFVSVTSESVSNLDLRAVKATALIYGSLKDDTGGALSGVDLLADGSQPPSYFYARGRSDADGNYALGVNAAEVYYASLDPRGCPAPTRSLRARVQLQHEHLECNSGAP